MQQRRSKSAVWTHPGHTAWSLTFSSCLFLQQPFSPTLVADISPNAIYFKCIKKYVKDGYIIQYTSFQGLNVRKEMICNTNISHSLSFLQTDVSEKIHPSNVLLKLSKCKLFQKSFYHCTSFTDNAHPNQQEI